MENKKITSVLETLKEYKSEFESEFAVDLPPDNMPRLDINILDGLIEAVISLICKIGINDDMTPNVHGMVLDNALEALNQIRQEYYN